MTVREFIAELEQCKREAASYKHQMEVNLDYCHHYESALTTIAKMCGYEIPSGSCHGCPEEIDGIAIRLVKELVEKQKQVK